MKHPKIVIAALTISGAGFVGILNREGFSDKAYPDPVHGTAVPTIGFGTTEGVKMGDTITVIEALDRAKKDVTKFEGAVKRCVTVPLSQQEYDTYLDFAYNVGSYGFCSSELVKKLNRQDYLGACGQILRWRFAGRQDCSDPNNRTCRGLWTARLRQHEKCLEANR